MPFVEKKLDEFFTAENAESAEKRFTTKHTKGTKLTKSGSLKGPWGTMRARIS